MRWVVWVMLGVMAAGCGGEEPGDPDPIRGPEGGVLRFDGAMIGFDGGVPDAPRDAPRLDVPLDVARPDVPGPRRCVGLARSCLSYGSLSDCELQDGCRNDGECRGVSTSCYSRYSSYACASQDGCVWDSSRDECSGSARSCSGYSGQSSCLGQDGCYWEDQCAGSALPCGAFTEATCTLQEGCYLE